MVENGNLHLKNIIFADWQINLYLYVSNIIDPGVEGLFLIALPKSVNGSKGRKPFNPMAFIIVGEMVISCW